MKIIITILVIALSIVSCNKVENILPKENEKATITSTNRGNGVTPQSRPRGAEVACIKTDQNGKPICAGTMCHQQLLGECFVSPWHCINFRDPSMPIPAEMNVIVFENKNEFEEYKEKYFR